MNPKPLHEYQSLYLQCLVEKNRPTRSIESQGHEVNCFFKFLQDQGIEDLRQVSQKDVESYQSTLYYWRNAKGHPLTTGTQSTKLGAIRSFFKTMIQAGHLLFNPALEIELPREGKRIPRNLLSGDEVKKLMSAPDLKTVYGYRDRTLLEVLYATGIVPQELQELRLNDVDCEKETLRVKNSLRLKDRLLPLTAIALNFLKEYIHHVRPLLVKREGETRLFLSKSGNPIDRSALHKKTLLYSLRAGLGKKVSARTLRCTMAVELAAKVDLRHLQEILGNRSLERTQVYATLAKGDLKRTHRKTHPREQRVMKGIHYQGGRRE